MEATWWLKDKLGEWLGEKNAADTLTLSAPGNITSEMGLALLDVADVIRPQSEVTAFLQGVEGEGFLDELAKLAGGTEARQALEAYLDQYGMRCVGEIDITRPRWRERPTTLVPVILDNVRNFESGAAERHFEQGRQRVLTKERDVLSRLSVLPDGAQKADETKWMIDRVRTFIGYREYPKYVIVSRYFIYKQALLSEAERLVRANVIPVKETSSTSRSRNSTTSCARARWMIGSSSSARKRSGRITRSRPPGCSHRMEKPSPGRTGAMKCRRVPWSACQSPPGRSRERRASSLTWQRPTSRRVTSWSQPTRIPAGRPCSSESRPW
ncbi:MAG TPA: hypothetical protein VMU95_34555 [Trebonia sp.]|nr:hypothetical protein [Trebonia sp.]